MALLNPKKKPTKAPTPAPTLTPKRSSLLDKAASGEYGGAFQSLAQSKTSNTPRTIDTPTSTATTAGAAQSSAETQARNFLDSNTFQQPESVTDIANRKRKEAQGLIDATKDLYTSEYQQIEQRRNQAQSEQNAFSVMTGVAGSGRASAASQGVDKSFDQERAQRAAELSSKLEGIYTQISTDAASEARQQMVDARTAAEGVLQRGEQDRARTAEQQTKAMETLTTLAQSGAVDFDAFKSNPQNKQVYDYALRTVNGSEQALKALFVLNTPQEAIVDKRVEGNKYMIVKQHPITGKTSIETLDLPFETPTDWQSVDLGGYVMFFDPADPDKRMTFDKTLTPTQATAASVGGTGNPAVDSWVDLINGGQATITNVPSAIRNAVASALSGSNPNAEDPQKTREQLNFLKSTADEALKLYKASGPSGISKYLGDTFVGDSDFRQLESATNTLRTNVLALMTDPSIKKFFGPQMSNADVQLMTATGTTLNPEKQSPKLMKEELERLQGLFDRMLAAVPSNATPSAIPSSLRTGVPTVGMGVMPTAAPSTNDPLGLF